MFNKKLMKTIGSCLFLIVLCFGLISSASAAEIGIDKDVSKQKSINSSIIIGPNTPGGLKEAIKLAKTNDTIFLKNGVYTGENNTGISINKSISIEGLGSNVTINAQGKNRIFDIEKGKVTLKKLKLINGYAYGKNPYGGAIYSNGSLKINDCIFMRNKADAGGAIYSEGKTYIVNCTFKNNQAKLYGGAIYSSLFSTINKCIFTNNTAKEGGAIYGSDQSLKNSIFKGNKADVGGAVYFRYSAINNCTFKNNQARLDGGAIFSTQSTVNKCIFNNNQARRHGGAIYEYEHAYFFESRSTDISIFKVRNSKFTHNQAKKSGGAIYFDGNSTDLNSTIDKCLFQKNKAGNKGGAIYNIVKSVKIANSKFKNNIAGNVFNAIFSKTKISKKNVKITPKDGTKVKKIFSVSSIKKDEPAEGYEYTNEIVEEELS